MKESDRSKIENPYFSREIMKEASVLIEATKKISQAINKLLPDLRLRRYAEPRVTIVGGFVRDSLIGGKPKDADVEVFGVPPAKLLKILENIFGEDCVKADVGKSFGVIKVFLGKGMYLDVSLPRVDSRGKGEGHKDIKAKSDSSLPIKEAQRRRDFTINALNMGVDGEIIDSWGGVEDLQNKVLRLVDEETFKQDPLRVLRGVQFVARFGLTVEPKTFSFMKEMVANGALDHLPADRIRDEIKKLLTKSEKPSVGLELIRELGILERHFPELNALIGCEQEPEWHPEGDVWTHTKLVVDKTVELLSKRFFKPEEMSEDEYKEIVFSVMLGSLAHDFGKPATAKVESDGRNHFFGHETEGENPARIFLSRINVSKKVLDNVIKLVKLHRKPERDYLLFNNNKITKEKYAGKIKALIDELGGFPLSAFLVVCEADYFGKSVPEREKTKFAPTDEIFKIISEANITNKPLLQGCDVLSLWQEIKGEKKAGGVWVGSLLKRIKQEELADRQAALRRLRELIETE